MTLRLTRDDVSPALALLTRRARRPRGIFAAAGRAVVNLFRKTLRGFDRSRPNRLGGQRQHFWLALSRSVNLSSLSDIGATISISDPRAQLKHFGGTIRAKRAKFLTIPVHPDAYGRRASVLAAEKGIKLFVWNGKLMGQLADQPGVTVYYILKTSVTLAPDPPGGILPPEDQIRTVALQAGQAAFNRQMQNN